MDKKILTYIDLLKDYNEHTNIYSKNAYDKLDFHLKDSLTLASLIGDRDLRIADFGSGSGLPAVILAISNPMNSVFAIESKSRKARFLDLVVNNLGLNNLFIVNSNLFEWVRIVSDPFDIITAKAFGSVDKIKSLAKPISSPTHTKLFIPFSKNQAVDYHSSLILEYNNFLYYSETLL